MSFHSLPSKHNKGVAICKGICICLMVIGHTGFSGIIADWLYSFRMPLFFFMSGYMFKPESTLTPKRFIWKRLKGLYWPFVKWSLIFIIFHNLLFNFNFYHFPYSFDDFKSKIFKVLTLNGTDQLLGGYWFLVELLLASSIAYCILFIIYRFIKIDKLKSISILKYFSLLISNMKINEKKLQLLLILIVGVCLIYMSFLIGTNKFLKIKSLTILATVFFILGHFFRTIDIKVNFWQAIIIMGMAFVFSRWINHPLTMHATGIDIFALIPMALLSVLGLLGISKYISKSKFGDFLDYAGSNTLMILTFHFLSFKLVSISIIYRDSLDFTRLGDFPIITTTNNFDWIIYTIIGVTLPLLGVWAVDKIKKIKKEEKLGVRN